MSPDRTHHRHRSAPRRTHTAERRNHPASVLVEGRGGHPVDGAPGAGPAPTSRAASSAPPGAAGGAGIAPTAGVTPAEPAGATPGVGAADDPVVGGYSHVALLSLARTIQTAAVTEDLESLVATVRRLHEGLHSHVASEREEQDHLPAALRAVVFGGQDRLLRMVDRIAADAGSAGACACVRYGAELVVALRRQAALEAAALRRPSRPA